MHFDCGPYSLVGRRKRGLLLEIRLDPTALNTHLQPFYSFFAKVTVHFSLIRSKHAHNTSYELRRPSSVVWEFDKNRGLQQYTSGKGQGQKREPVISNYENPHSFVTTDPPPNVANLFDRKARSTGKIDVGMTGLSIFTSLKLRGHDDGETLEKEEVEQVMSGYKVRALIELESQGAGSIFRLKSHGL